MLRDRKKERRRERDRLEHGGRAGVYTLLFPSNAIYVGASFRVRGRVRDHLARLKRREHENPILQSVFDHFGGQVKVTVREVAIETAEELAVFERVLIREQLQRRPRDLVLNRSLSVLPIMLNGPRRIA